MDFDEYLKKNYDGRAAATLDIVPKIQALLQGGYYLTPDGKIAPTVKARSTDTPWIYTRSNPELNCGYYHSILFGTLGVFPSKCIDCWKVVVRPRTVRELMALYDLQQDNTRQFCKCGIELRPTVPANYGGYFYTRSKEEGLDCLDEIREIVGKNISPGIDIFLKRYCTEYEIAFGPSDVIEETLANGYYIDPERGPVAVMQHGDMATWEEMAGQVFDTAYSHADQPPFIRQHIIRRWYEHAWSIGDMTVKEFFGGQPLVAPPVRYER